MLAPLLKSVKMTTSARRRCFTARYVGALPPQEESYRFAELIAHEEVRSIVINMEHAAFDQGLAQQLANHLKAPCYALSELKAENLYHTVRQEMANPTGKTTVG